METRNTFDLHKQINQWKSELNTSAQLDQDCILELESHLLDEIDGLSDSKLNDEEKLMIAQHRIGSEKLLAKAYKDTKGFNFQKVSWFGQALILLGIFIVTSRMTMILASHLPLTPDSWFGNTLLGASTLLLLIKIPALLVVYFTYRWTQKQIKVTKANSIALVTLTVLSLIYLVQIFTFSSESLVMKRSIWPMFWAASTYILVFIAFVILNVRQIRKSRRSLQIYS